MNYPDWIQIAPSALAAIATFAAAIAAFGSLKVSRESKLVAQQSALAVHHGPAANSLTDALETIAKELVPLSEYAFDVWVEWAREIEKYNCLRAGGSDPRPLRHVLTNASEMLERHASKNGKDYSRSHRAIFTIVRNGMGETSGSEYKRLLKKADRTYFGFEAVFGAPQLDKPISSSNAFRWAYYQLTHRVIIDNWRDTWAKAWQDNGWLLNYCGEFERVKPILRATFESLKVEKAKLEHSVFPLEANPSLSHKYSWTLGVLESLLESGGLDLFDFYIEDPHDADLVPLIVCAMGMALLTNRAVEALLHDTQIYF
jgi:hypothetical protein